jgi:hypothetical protein
MTEEPHRMPDVPSLARAALVALVALAFAATPLAASAQTAAAVTEQRFADGSDWAQSSAAQKHAFVNGIANTLSVGVGWDERHVPAGQVTFARRARDGLSGTSLAEVVRRVDAWYAANPSRRETPVVAVMWLEIAKPRLQAAGK